MNQGHRDSQDITDLFSGETSGSDEEVGANLNLAGHRPPPAPIFDPLGLLEDLSRGRVRDPIRTQLIKFLDRLRSDPME